MTQRTRRIFVAAVVLTALVGGLGLVCAPAPQPVIHEVEIGDLTIKYTLVDQTRITRTEFEYVYRAMLTNGGQADLVGSIAHVSSNISSTEVTDDSVEFGHTPVGGTIEGMDTFSFRHDRRVPFDPSTLSWMIEPIARLSAPAGWRAETPGQLTILTSPETASLLDALGPDAVEIPSEIGVEILDNPQSLPLDEFVDAYFDGYYADYTRRVPFEIRGRAALRLDDRHGLPFPKFPVLVAFIDAPPIVLMIGFNRQTISAQSLDAFEQLLTSIELP